MLRSFALFAVLCLASPALAEEALPAAGKQALMFRLPTYNAKASGHSALGLDRFVGQGSADKDAKVVLLSFMASFCAPCKKELPYLQKLHETYGPKGLRVVLVSIDDKEEGQKIIEELIEKNKVTFPVLKDRFQLVARRWLGTQFPLPSVFMVKPSGEIATVHRGYSEEASTLLDQEIQTALK